MFVHRAPDHGHADLLCDLVAHLRKTRTGNEKRHAHLRGFDHHFAGQSSRGVENFVAAVDAIEPHHPGNRIHRVVTTHVFDEIQKLRRCAEERAAMHRAGLLVNRFVFAHQLGQRVERRLREARFERQFHVINVGHQIAKHGAAAAAGGLGSMRHFFVEIDEAVPGVNGGRVDLPIHLHSDDFIERIDQALVAQITEHQGFRRCAERHQREDLALVDVHRQRVFARHKCRAGNAMFISRRDFKCRRSRAFGELRAIAFIGGVRVSFLQHALMLAMPSKPKRKAEKNAYSSLLNALFNMGKSGVCSISR